MHRCGGDAAVCAGVPYPARAGGLLSFLLSTLIRRLEYGRVGRIGASLVTAALAFVLIGGLAYLVTIQFLDLAGPLPKCRSKLIARVTPPKTSERNLLRLAVQTIGNVTSALNKSEDANPARGFEEKARPMRVEVIEPAGGSILMLMGML